MSLMFLAAFTLGVSPVLGAPQAQKARVLILVVDGLRPDYVTADLMPRLNAVAEVGVRGLAHHAVFPTVTRVNGSSIFTGHYPAGHGLLGNSVYFPEVDSSRVLNMGVAEDLLLIDQATDGGLLTVPSLGELLGARGLTFFAASSGSTGSGMLMNHRGAGGGLVHHSVTIPDTLGPVVLQALGILPTTPAGESSVPLVARAVDAVLRIGVDRVDADVLAAWLTEPDGTAHRTGVGSPETVEVLSRVDAEIGRLLDGLRERRLLQSTDILVTSDHGFAKRIGQESITGLLVRRGLKVSSRSTDVVVAGGAIHVREGGAERVGAIVRLLQETDWVGAVFTPAASPRSDVGTHPGTVAFSSIGWSHERSADILVSGDWSDAVNDFGYPGAVLTPGVAGHGSSSPWDILATFLASGPSIKRSVVSRVPTGNIDIVPTVLTLIGASLPVDLDGRVLFEVFSTGPDPDEIGVVSDPITVVALLEGLRYQLTVNRSRVGSTMYFDGTSVERRR